MAEDCIDEDDAQFSTLNNQENGCIVNGDLECKNRDISGGIG